MGGVFRRTDTVAKAVASESRTTVAVKHAERVDTHRVTVTWRVIFSTLVHVYITHTHNTSQ